MRKVLPLALLAWSSVGVAQPKISILPFSGPGGATARNQMVAALCDQAECVPPAKVTAGPKPDWKKAKKLKVKYILEGKITKKGKKSTLTLEVFRQAAGPYFKKAFPLAGNELNVLNLSVATTELSKVMKLGAGEKTAKPDDEEDEDDDKKKKDAEDKKKKDKEDEEKRKKDKEDEDTKKKPPEGEEDTTSDDEDTKKSDKKDKKHKKDKDDEEKQRKDDEKARKEEEKREREEKKKKREEEKRAEEEKKKKDDEESSSDEDDNKTPRHIVLGADLGVELMGKYFSYTQTDKSNLRSYNAPLAVAPSFKLEFYPIALFTRGIAAGIGLDGGASFAVGLKSHLPSVNGAAPVSFPTSLVRVDFGVRFRIRPFAGSDAAIVPIVGVRVHSFKVGAAADGSVIDGLPGISYTALKLGLAGEIPIGERLAFSASFTAMPLLGYGEIISPDWFPKGGGFGFDIGASMTFKIAGPLHIKVGGNFTRYGLTFETTPTDTYVAAGAVDIHAGGFVGLRLAF